MNITRSQSDYYVARLRLGCKDLLDIIGLESREDFSGVFSR